MPVGINGSNADRYEVRIQEMREYTNMYFMGALVIQCITTGVERITCCMHTLRDAWVRFFSSALQVPAAPRGTGRIKGMLQLRKDICTACGMCVCTCPTNCISISTVSKDGKGE